MHDAAVREVDAFDLPEWLGVQDVTWTAASTVRDTYRVRGDLVGSGSSVACDLLAVDLAYPAPVLEPTWRTSAHQQWTHGQVLLLEYDGRLTLAVPGTHFTADLVLECLSRLAKALGVKPDRIVAALRL